MPCDGHCSLRLALWHCEIRVQQALLTCPERGEPSTGAARPSNVDAFEPRQPQLRISSKFLMHDVQSSVCRQLE